MNARPCSVVRRTLRRSKREAGRNARGSYAKDVRTLLPAFVGNPSNLLEALGSRQIGPSMCAGSANRSQRSSRSDRTGVHGITAGGNCGQPGRGGSVLRRSCGRRHWVPYGVERNVSARQPGGGSGPQRLRPEEGLSRSWTAQVARRVATSCGHGKESPDENTPHHLGENRPHSPCVFPPLTVSPFVSDRRMVDPPRKLAHQHLHLHHRHRPRHRGRVEDLGAERGPTCAPDQRDSVCDGTSDPVFLVEG